jgi:regulator of protease activity HflC (stomatin/prohibitin superfamily)
MIQEKSFSPQNGYLMLLVMFAVTAVSILAMVLAQLGVVLVVGLTLAVLMLPGFFIVAPNSSKVLVLFGKYKGTVKQDGFHWANPFMYKHSVSLRARNMDTEKIKVNDKQGNPIIISAVVVWQVTETAHAMFEVDDYEHFVRVQSDAAVRILAGHYSYDHMDEDESSITLRAGGEQVNNELERELQERLSKAGVSIIEARINHLAYAEEIAGAMLQRQQASAIIAARRMIVDGAVGMVEMALHKLEQDHVVHLDAERKAAMVSNLLVVLCSDRAAHPVVNAGSLY